MDLIFKIIFNIYIMQNNKVKILNILDKKIQNDNFNKIKKLIYNKEDINYKLAEQIIVQYDCIIVLKETKNNTINTQLTLKENIIYKNNIIIKKLNKSVENYKTKCNNLDKSCKEYENDIININNKSHLEILNNLDIIDNKNKIINDDKIHLNNLNNKYGLILNNVEKYKLIVTTYNNEIFNIYKFSINVLLFSQFLNYININSFIFQIFIILFGHLFFIFNKKINFSIK